MSDAGKQNEDLMIARLIEIEEARLTPGLSAEGIASVQKRLLAEKDTILAGFDRTPVLAVAKKSSPLKIWLPVAAAAALIIGVGVPFFLGKSPGIDARLQAVRGPVQLNGATAQPGAPLTKENILATQAKGHVVIAWGEGATTLIGQNTKVAVRRLEKADRPRIEIENLQGLVFTRVEKGLADFTVLTPTAVLGVRGTSFSVSVTADGTTLSVLDGVVATKLNAKFIDTLPEAQRAKAAEPILVNPKQKIVISAGQKSATVSALTETEVQQLTKLGKLVALSREKAGNVDAQRGAAIVKETDTLLAEVLAAEANTAANGVPKLTLEDIRKKYGKVSRVNLKTGASYVGYFVLKGAQMEIVTPRGVVRVPTAQLKDVQDLN